MAKLKELLFDLQAMASLGTDTHEDIAAYYGVPVQWVEIAVELAEEDETV